MSTLKVQFEAFVLAAAIGLAACTGPSDAPRAENAITHANGPAVATAGPKAVDIATGFLDAYGAFDAKKAMTFVADDADLAGLIESQVPADVNGLSLQLAFLEAEGYKQEASCEPGTEAVDTSVICSFDFHAIRSDEMGRGPFSGSNFMFSIRDGAIVQASIDWDIEKFSPQIWEPFADWMSTTYPKDAAAMYQDETLSNFRLTEESIRLWQQRSREYVAVATPATVTIAERFMEARDAHDAETIMALLADDGARVQLLIDNAMDPDMGPGIPLDRDELALALEAERLYGVRYEHVDCVRRYPDQVWWGAPRSANVICTYSMDSALRQIAGSDPTESTVALGIREGHVDLLSFPWLTLSFPSFVPAEGWRFARWLGREHPDAGGPMVDGELFRTFGQELTLKLTPKAIGLLDDYLEEYKRSVQAES